MNKKKRMNIIIIILAVLVVLMVVASILIKKNKNDASSEKETETTTSQIDAIIAELDKCNDPIEKVSLTYTFLDISKGRDEYADSRRDAYVYLIDYSIENDNNYTAYNVAKYASQEFSDILEGYLKNRKIKECYDKPEKRDNGFTYFGGYPQAEIPLDKVPEYVKNMSFDKYGVTEIYGKKYAIIEKNNEKKYFLYDEIEWRFLIDLEDGPMYMTNLILDGESYMLEMEDSSWDTSHMREWLNDEYYNRAFNQAEKDLLNLTLIKRPYNYFYSTYSGEDSESYLGILSCADLVWSEYGLKTEDFDIRQVKATDYAKARGVFTDEDGKARWWTSSNGSNHKTYVYVNYDGVITSGGEIATYDKIGVRPVITLKK